MCCVIQYINIIQKVLCLIDSLNIQTMDGPNKPNVNSVSYIINYIFSHVDAEKFGELDKFLGVDEDMYRFDVLLDAYHDHPFSLPWTRNVIFLN